MCLSKLKISVFRMAVSPEYKTPWCGWVEWKDKTKIIQGMNCEGRTRKEALLKIITMIDDEAKKGRT